MSKPLLTSAIQKAADISRTEAQLAADAAISAIVAGLKASGTFVMPGFGTFTAAHRKVKFVATPTLLKEIAGDKPEVMADPSPPLATGKAKTVKAAAKAPAVKLPKAAKVQAAKPQPLRRARATPQADSHAA